jgi:hypothetical protein
MKIYQVHYWSGHDGSHGFGFFWNKKDALKAARDFDKENKDNDSEVDAIRFHMNKEGIMTLLGATAMHPDNG